MDVNNENRNEQKESLLPEPSLEADGVWIVGGMFYNFLRDEFGGHGFDLFLPASKASNVADDICHRKQYGKNNKHKPLEFQTEDRPHAKQCPNCHHSKQR